MAVGVGGSCPGGWIPRTSSIIKRS